MLREQVQMLQRFASNDADFWALGKNFGKEPAKIRNRLEERQKRDCGTDLCAAVPWERTVL